MAYLRWNELLPSGETCKYFVIGGHDGLINFDVENNLIPYQIIRDIFRQTPKSELEGKLKGLIRRGIQVDGEELDVLYERLIEEKDNREWDEPFDFEKVC